MHARAQLNGMIGAALLAVAAASPTHADEAKASFAVTATVRARASLTAIDAQPELALSPEDVQRGYKDVGLRYLLRQHGARGCLIRLGARSGLSTRLEVTGLTSEVVIGEDLVEVYYPERGGAETIDLRLRVVLDPRARAGRYPFPLLIDVVAL